MKITFKPNNLLLVNLENSHDQLEPIVQSVWGNLPLNSLIAWIPIEMNVFHLQKAECLNAGDQLSNKEEVVSKINIESNES